MASIGIPSYYNERVSDSGSERPSSIDQVRRQVIESMRGSSVVIPDLQCLVSHWPSATHPEIERLEEDVFRTLESIFPSLDEEKRRRKLKASGVAFFGASWWAYASFEALRIGTYLATWLFIWDDETDSHEYSPLIYDFEEACAFRRETMQYLQETLSRQSTPSSLERISSNPIITNFRPVGEAVSKSCSDYQTERFMDELRFFIEMTEEEHDYQITQRVPTIKEYTKRRMGSGGVRVCLAISEYTRGIEIPEHVMRSRKMQTIWNETNIIICTTNDILSVKKEVDQSQIDSLIPLLFIEHKSVQTAVDRAVHIVQSAIKRLDATEADILKSYASNPKLYKDISQFIEGCKYAVTGNLNWSLGSKRYGLDCQSMKNGIRITL
ncbi:isoprenoid synthase domain-containing protein [Jackrogersella minutella]|nr:isoprenoid synthase domain-containing protein [Jackrogersella minutella]